MGEPTRACHAIQVCACANTCPLPSAKPSSSATDGSTCADSGGCQESDSPSHTASASANSCASASANLHDWLRCGHSQLRRQLHPMSILRCGLLPHNAKGVENTHLRPWVILRVICGLPLRKKAGGKPPLEEWRGGK